MRFTFEGVGFGAWGSPREEIVLPKLLLSVEKGLSPRRDFGGNHQPCCFWLLGYQRLTMFRLRDGIGR